MVHAAVAISYGRLRVSRCGRKGHPLGPVIPIGTSGEVYARICACGLTSVSWGWKGPHRRYSWTNYTARKIRLGVERNKDTHKEENTLSISLSSLSKEILASALPALTKKRDALKAELIAIEADITAINAVLNPLFSDIVKTVRVRSESEWNKFYDVVRTSHIGSFPYFTYTCACKAFIFSNGLDANGHCKHIQRAIKDRLFA